VGEVAPGISRLRIVLPNGRPFAAPANKAPPFPVGGARLSLLVLHDDAEREYAYGPATGLPETKVGTFTQALYDEAKNNAWTVISMKKAFRDFSSLRIHFPGGPLIVCTYTYLWRISRTHFTPTPF
jgi:hypothetical protein